MSEEIIERSTLLVDIDSLFDTRLATLFTMGEEVADLVLCNNYYEREHDFWVGVDLNRYNELYKNRNKNILKNALMTKIILMIKEFVLGTLEVGNYSPFKYKPKIILNIYPYSLTESECNIFINGLKENTNSLADIELIRFSYKDITPLWIKENCSLVFMYHFRDWFNVNKNEFSKNSCPEVSLITPAIFYTNKDLEQQKRNSFMQLGIHPFKATEKRIKPFIDLRLIHIENFCIGLRLEKPIKVITDIK